VSHRVTNRLRGAGRLTVVVAGVSAAVGIGGAAHAQAPPAAGDQYVASYADGVFIKRGMTLHLAPGVIDDRGTVSEVLEASVHSESCEGRFLITVDVSTSASAPDLDGVAPDARGGMASVAGTYALTGTVTITPAGRRCASPNEAAATTAPLTADVAVDATWRNARDSKPIVYSGNDCGGDGICYYRDASGRASWDSPFIGSATTRSESAFFFEGTYSAESAALAQIPIT
jgi:hypothetical protein